MEDGDKSHRSILIDFFSDLIEFANDRFVLSHYLIRDNRDVFYRLEKMMLWIIAFCVLVLLTLHLMPPWLMLLVSILLLQRVVEFLIVYSRNFIFNRGRIFTEYKDSQRRGEWLIMMFSLNILQIVLTFSVWYRALSLHESGAFSRALSTLDSFYFSVVTFMTVGFGDITPVSALAKTLVLFQTALTFYTLVIVINGLISIHFTKRQ